MSVLDWLTARILDAHIAVEEMPPAWTVFLGLALFGGTVATVTWLAVNAWERRRTERELPEPESLTVSESWLADRTIEIPPPTRQPMRRRHRYPVARHVPVTTRWPDIPVDEYPTIVLRTVAQDPDMTVPIRGAR